MKKLQFSSLHTFDKYLVIVICVLVALRIAILPLSPPGFYMDESAGSAHVASMVQHGTNAFGQPWPLFSTALGGGYTTPVYLYPAAAWSSVFGFSPLSLRFFSEVMTLAAIAFIAFAMRLWTNRRTALIAACVGLALPWGWLQGSLVWDPALVPFFVGLAFLAFSQLLFTKSVRTKYLALFLLPLSLILLAYLYPPLRVSAPILFVAAYILLYKRQIIHWPTLILTILGSAVISLPLLHFMQDPESLARSQNLLVFSQMPLLPATGTFLLNMLQLVSPWFLFVTGDPNLRHSTFFEGMLGIAAVPAIVAVIMMVIKYWKKSRRDLLLVWIALFGIVVSLAGSALTAEGQPHSLRATAAWPFFVILLALGWQWIFAQKNKKYIKISVALFVIGTLSYAAELAFVYPQYGSGAFDKPIYEKAIQHQPTPDYPGLSLQYYDALR